MSEPSPAFARLQGRVTELLKEQRAAREAVFRNYETRAFRNYHRVYLELWRILKDEIEAEKDNMAPVELRTLMQTATDHVDAHTDGAR